jgi:hypothetical protein
MPTSAARTPIVLGSPPPAADAWLSALATYVRAARAHHAAAALHARLEYPERAAAETGLAAAERAAFDAALLKHPEWAAGAPAWSEPDALPAPQSRSAPFARRRSAADRVSVDGPSSVPSPLGAVPPSD